MNACTVRALVIGMGLSLIVGVLAPVNDWYCKNSYLYGQHMPVLVIACAAALGLINRYLGKWRFSGGECALILGMLLVIGGVVGTGLMRQWPAIVAGPARELTARPTTYAPLMTDGQPLPVSENLFIGLTGGRVPDQNDPTYRRLIDGFHHGGADPKDGFPWAQWSRAALAWLPLLACLLAFGLGVAALVRRQWMHHERLPFTLARVLGDLVDQESGGIWRNRWFISGLIVSAVILGSKILEAWGLFPTSFRTTLDVSRLFDPQTINASMSKNIILNWHIFIGVVGIAFLLPTDLSFSMWFFVILANVIFITGHSMGFPLSSRNAAEAGIGGFFVQATVILWIGRTYYLQAFKAAFSRKNGPLAHEAAWAARLLLVGAVGLLVVLCAMGAPVHLALLVILVSLGLLLVIGRLVAEGGIPLINIPQLPNELIYALTGTSGVALALFPLSLVWMITDGREHIVPYAITADAVAERQGVPSGPRWTGVLTIAVVIAAIASGCSMLWLAYFGPGMNGLDGWWRVALGTGLTPLADAVRDQPAASGGGVAYAVGGVTTGALAVARMHFAWWPFHPLGFIVAMTYANQIMWFSFLLGWIAKVCVNRWGGQALYRQARLVAIGLIAGEALMVVLSLAIALTGKLAGYAVPMMPRFIPG